MKVVGSRSVCSLSASKRLTSSPARRDAVSSSGARLSANRLRSVSGSAPFALSLTNLRINSIRSHWQGEPVAAEAHLSVRSLKKLPSRSAAAGLPATPSTSIASCITLRTCVAVAHNKASMHT
jgi:hypothetical protein